MSPGIVSKGISMANVQNADLRDIKVTGLTGPLIRTSNVTGKGLEGAVAFDPPTAADPVPAAAPFVLK